MLKVKFNYAVGQRLELKGKTLSPAQSAVIAKIVEGYTDKGIADSSDRSVIGLRSGVAEIFKKLEVSNRASVARLVAQAYRNFIDVTQIDTQTGEKRILTFQAQLTENLTPRQIRTLNLFVKGKSDKEIAYEIGSRESTVALDKFKIRKVLGANTIQIVTAFNKLELK
jgi:DNA-binding NarL/FixJ family response regulator